jgi:hypothetical protein
MSFELKHTYELFIDGGRAGRVTPKGIFNLSLQKDSTRYRFMLEGRMTFTGDDFDLIYYSIKPTYPNQAGDRCAEFVLRCNFKGYIWQGYFTETDCDIHASKGYLEVEPHTDDGYRNFLPYMDMDFNIMPEYMGVRNDASVSGIFPFLTERRVVEISEPYTGLGAGAWTGYSVNDWIRGDYQHGYSYVGGKNNSLISYLAEDKRFGRITDFMNQLLWLDYEGYMRKVGGGEEADFFNAVFWARRYEYYPELFTLTEVINHYDEDYTWQYCTLVYEREVWPHSSNPPAGQLDIYSVAHRLHERQGKSRDAIIKELDKLGADVKNRRTGWMWNPDDKVWTRRPYALGEQYLGGSYNAARATAFGDGTWFGELSGFLPKQRGYIRKQALNHNPNYSSLDEYNRYITADGVLHRIPSVINKFLKFVVEQGGEEVLLDSEYLTANTTPLPYLKDDFGQPLENEWPRVLIMQNSDIRQIEGTEKSTKQEFTFARFLDMICDVANAGWAIISEGTFDNLTHRLVIEHKLFFENGLTYDTPTDAINPQDIYNFAKNKNFIRFSNQYRFNRPDMQKYEVFRTLGGDEPIHDNSWITYDSKCANNLPGQNKREISIESATTDYYYVMGEQLNEGITLVKTTLTGIGAMWQFELPLEVDMFGRYRINANFHLQHILMRYHTYGRSFTEGYINSHEGNFLTRPYVLQDVFFPYREQLNPYRRVLTELGMGVILDATLNAMTGIMDVTLGFHEGTLDGFDMPPFDWPDKSSNYNNLYFYKHVQTEPSDRWHIFHNLGTDAIMRPIVFQDVEDADVDIDGEGDAVEKDEIGYQGLVRMSPNVLVMEFSTPVTGEAYFLSFGFFNPYAHTQAEPSDTWEMPHNLDTLDVSHSIIWGADDREIRHDDIVIVDDNNMQYLFSDAVAGNMYLAHTPLLTTVDDIDGSDIEVSRPYQHPLKPLILRVPSEIGYDTNRMEETLIRLGFTHEVIATIIVKHYD